MKTTCCIDLDQTLLASNSLIESILAILRKNPLYLLLLLVWVLQGPARFKTLLAARVNLDPANLPYNSDVIQWIKTKKSQGHPIYLVSAAHETIANAVAKHIGLFDGVLATTAKNNLKGLNKALACCDKFGVENFIYVGDSTADLAVWQQAQSIVCVTHNKTLIKKCSKISNNVTVIPRKKPKLKDYLKAIRIHQYVKNTLIFLPLLLAGNMHYPLAIWKDLGIAFVIFCLTCSSLYLWNDLYDLNSDRQHKEKSQRGLASGLVPLPVGIWLIVAFMTASAMLQFYFNHVAFSIALIGYFILSIAYSHHLKKVAIIDTMVLTTLYTMRIVAGMIIIHSHISNWLLSFSMFFFLSLSFLKRYIELSSMKKDQKYIPGRSYGYNHRLFVSIIGISCGCISTFIFTLYIASLQAHTIHKNTTYLYIISFIIFYWVQRIWLLAIDNKVEHDPIMFSIKDKVSYILGVASLAIIMLSDCGNLLCIT